MTGPPLVVKQWVNTEEPLKTLQCQGKYVKVIGSLRNFNGQRSMLAMDVRLITDLNEITSHMMEVVRAHMQLSRKTLDVNMNVLAAAGTRGAGPPEPGFLRGLSAVQEQVLEAIRRRSYWDQGLGLDELRAELSYLRIADIRTSLAFLLNEGHVFSTIDEHHFKAAEY
ncbi:replication protein A 32 kDa subunit-like isoform X2 [Salarias fasciatus]|nr:replication protein A 32 kDa subunit-like isoform X2 [Salarias fasciatus]